MTNLEKLRIDKDVQDTILQQVGAAVQAKRRIWRSAKAIEGEVGEIDGFDALTDMLALTDNPTREEILAQVETVLMHPNEEPEDD